MSHQQNNVWICLQDLPVSKVLSKYYYMSNAMINYKPDNQNRLTSRIKPSRIKNDENNSNNQYNLLQTLNLRACTSLDFMQSRAHTIQYKIQHTSIQIQYSIQYVWVCKYFQYFFTLAPRYLQHIFALWCSVTFSQTEDEWRSLEKSILVLPLLIFTS